MSELIEVNDGIITPTIIKVLKIIGSVEKKYFIYYL
jgi:hypothetical protein